MSITRDKEYPAEIAQLIQALNVCADGYDALAVLNASLQMVTASIGFIAKQKGGSLKQALGYEAYVSGLLRKEIENNWNRRSEHGDVEVKPS